MLHDDDVVTNTSYNPHINELIEHGGLAHPIVRAVRDRAVCMANPFRCKVLHKKASLAVLSDERNAKLFSARERKVIAEHVPWTRVVEERRTSFAGRSVELLPFIVANREQLVLKPNDDYGGAGIVLGWEVDDATWASALRHSAASPPASAPPPGGTLMIGAEASAYTELVPVLLRGLERIYLRTPSRTLREHIVRALLGRWTEASEWRLLWGPGNTLLLLKENGELIRAPASPEGFRPTARAQIAEHLA